MKKFSRWMPPTRANESVFAELFFLAISAAFWPILALCHIAHRRHLRRLATHRGGNDIGTFARAFDRHSEPFDPWVLRATWEAVSAYVTFDGRRLPLRPDDRLGEDLCIDPSDIEDLILEVAKRSGHSVETADSNPYYGRVKTVGDLVRFVTLQPSRA